MDVNAILSNPIDRSLHEILVVDDNPVTRYATARLLRSVGFRVREAVNGAQALQLADDTISAMVLDIHLPDIDGLEICRILRSQPRQVRLPVLHLTAQFVTDEDKVRGLDSGADAYLTHPVEPAVLVASVQALVRARVAEESMQASEAKFRALYDQAPSGIGLIDRDGRFTDANPALLKLLQRSRDHVIGQRLSAFATADWVEAVDEQLVCDNPGEWRNIVTMLDGTSDTLHVEWRFSAPPELGVSIGVATDVSERVSLEATRRGLLEREQSARSEAERVSRLKDDLIAVLSHELRTPLNAIMGWVHVLQKIEGLPLTARGLGAIERNAKTQARLISDILDVSSINMGKLRLHLEQVEPAELLTTSVEALRPSFDEKGVKLALDIGQPMPLVQADPARFQQIVWNLLSNALKFSPAGSEIRVALQAEGEGAEAPITLTVSDQGQGIAPEFLPFLFDRFSQGEASRNRMHGGLGLGLSIVRHLVELHGGRVTAHSEGVGRGAEFRVSFPPGGAPRDTGVVAGDTESSDLAADASRPTDSLQGVSVLLVDDDPDACQMLELILTDHDATVHVAHNYEDALRTLQTLSPDVLVSDVGMPGNDGYALLRELRRRESPTRHLPAIALTSFTRPQDVHQAIAAGFNTHVGKPLRPLELIRAIVALARKAGV